MSEAGSEEGAGGRVGNGLGNGFAKGRRAPLRGAAFVAQAASPYAVDGSSRGGGEGGRRCSFRSGRCQRTPGPLYLDQMAVVLLPWNEGVRPVVRVLERSSLPGESLGKPGTIPPLLVTCPRCGTQAPVRVADLTGDGGGDPSLLPVVVPADGWIGADDPESVVCGPCARG